MKLNDAGKQLLFNALIDKTQHEIFSLCAWLSDRIEEQVNAHDKFIFEIGSQYLKDRGFIVIKFDRDEHFD